MSAEASTEFGHAALAARVRAVADFPRPGVVFRDVTPLLAEADAFAACTRALCAPWRDGGVDVVCGVESRGFIFGATMARELGAGFVPVRKPGKLPPPIVEVAYALEYGQDRLQLRADALARGQRVLLVDDVLATGGTLLAALDLVQRVGAQVVGAGVLIELPGLGARQRWPAAIPLTTLLTY